MNVAAAPKSSAVIGKRIRVMIVDDAVVVRGLFSRWVGEEGDLEVVAALRTGREAVNQLERADPDVVVLDVELPGGSGIGAVEALRAEAPDVRVLMLSGFSDPTRVRAALRAGASGYVLKNAPPQEIIDSIRRVAAGRSVLAPVVAETIAATLRDEPEEERARRRLASLSERELEVLRLAAEGESNADIGKRLFISEGTVKNHMTHILRKLDVEDRTQAAILVVKHGMER
jgi:DNA-binding NarL/FixJ family response regulator